MTCMHLNVEQSQKFKTLVNQLNKLLDQFNKLNGKNKDKTAEAFYNKIVKVFNKHQALQFSVKIGDIAFESDVAEILAWHIYRNNKSTDEYGHGMCYALTTQLQFCEELDALGFKSVLIPSTVELDLNLMNYIICGILKVTTI